MQELDQEAPSTGLNFHDVLFILCKHKWKIVLCVIVGLAAAAGFYFLNAPLYESDAKLLVRYVVERSAIDPVENANGGASKLTDSVINSEIEILTSWDLCEQVAETVGIKVDGARTVNLGLTATAGKGSSVILVSYKNSDPELAVRVLEALLKGYFTKHLDIHRSKAAFDRVSQQTEIVRGELVKTEDDLKKKKADAGIISVSDTAAAIGVEMADTEKQLNAAKTELASQRALVAELEKSIGGSGASPANQGQTVNRGAESPKSNAAQADIPQPDPAKPHASAEDAEKYQGFLDEIAALRRKGFELRASYNADTRPVKLNQSEIADLESQRHDLERKYPDLLGRVATSLTPQGRQPEVIMERARLASLEAGMLTLETRMHNAQERAKEFARIAPEIEELERDKQLQQANYTSSRSKLENASTDEALDFSKIPNISTVQKPSPAMKVAGTRQKITIGLAGGGIGLGLVLALLSEIVLDQTIKRPLEVERQLRIPLLISIPYLSPKHRSQAPRLNGKPGETQAHVDNPKNGNPTVAPWETAHFIRSYSEAIRDRLGLYFEVNNMTKKPKLIGVAGCSRKSGASTLAVGVAAALSETGDGKVLLVDMNVGQGEVHPFFQGRPGSALGTALQQDAEIASPADNLYLATGVKSAKLDAAVGFKRFHELMPNFKASDFDYIIFDMPPVGPTSPTSGMARSMDKVLFVIESERSNRSLVKRAHADLAAGHSDVVVVLNKVRSYAPRWIEGEL